MELFHQSAEEAYESALHQVLSPDGHRDIWREYIYYVRSKGVETGRGWQLLLDCVQRCVLDVGCTKVMPRLPSGAISSQGAEGSPARSVVMGRQGEERTECEDYTFHNEASGGVGAFEVMPHLSVYKAITFVLWSD